MGELISVIDLRGRRVRAFVLGEWLLQLIQILTIQQRLQNKLWISLFNHHLIFIQ